MSAARAKKEAPAIDILAKFLQRECGLVFADHKRYLFVQRLTPLLKRYNLASLMQLARALPSNSALRRDVIHQMTTHETLFFRDNAQFRGLEREVLPEIAARVAARKREGQRIDYPIWSAACSTGQEPMSLAMLVSEFCAKRADLGLAREDLRILATDISDEVLKRAKTGFFSQLEVGRGLDPRRTSAYFQPVEDGYQASEELKALVSFRPLNITRPFGAIGRFELVLCRNVLIYFDHETVRRTLDRIALIQGKGAYLMLGASESIYPAHEAYEELTLAGCTIYRRL